MMADQQGALTVSSCHGAHILGCVCCREALQARLNSAWYLQGTKYQTTLQMYCLSAVQVVKRLALQMPGPLPGVLKWSHLFCRSVKFLRPLGPLTVTVMGIMLVWAFRLEVRRRA